MKTKPFATTQWEYGPTGFGWFGSSGTSFIFTRDCGGTQKHCDTPHRGPRRKLPSSGSKVSRETGVLRVPWMQEYIKLGRCSEGKSFRAEAMGEGSMSKRSLALRVGGAAGDGVSSTAESFAKISARSGLHTWTYSSYQSVIRGGHVWTQVRGGLDPLLSHGDDPEPEVAQQNLQAAKLGASAVVEMGGSLHLGLAYTNEAKYLMTGNEALCLGALAAGVKFLAQYPMTPASSILHWMALHGPKYGVVVKQVEDELSAMNMAVGAGFAGVRSMTATSGGGFSLMVEAIGQAGMTETPLV